MIDALVHGASGHAFGKASSAHVQALPAIEARQAQGTAGEPSHMLEVEARFGHMEQ